MKAPAVATAAACICFGCVTEDFHEIGRSFDVPSPAQAARWAIDQQDPDRCREGLVLLSTATFGGDEVYVKLYRDYVESSENPLIRAAAIAALARHGTPADALIIAPWTNRRVAESETVRWAATKGLQRLHNPDVVPVLLDIALDLDEEAEIRSAACVALGQYPENRVVQALITALDAQHLSVNLDAAEALSLLTGKTFGLELTAWRVWYDAADESGTVFEGQQSYLYPTYARDSVWWERLAFWADEQVEPSLPPKGLTPADQMDTWRDFRLEGEEAGAPGDG